MANWSKGLGSLGSGLRDLAGFKMLQERDEANFLREQNLAQYKSQLAEARTIAAEDRKEARSDSGMVNNETGVAVPKGILSQSLPGEQEKYISQDDYKLKQAKKIKQAAREEGRKDKEFNRTMTAIDAASTMNFKDPSEKTDFITWHIDEQIKREQNGIEIPETFKLKALDAATAQAELIQTDEDVAERVQEKWSVKLKAPVTIQQAVDLEFAEVYASTASLGAKERGINKSKYVTKAERALKKSKEAAIKLNTAFKAASTLEDMDKIYQTKLAEAKTDSGKNTITAIYNRVKEARFKKANKTNKSNVLANKIAIDRKNAPINKIGSIWSRLNEGLL